MIIFSVVIIGVAAAALAVAGVDGDTAGTLVEAANSPEGVAARERIEGSGLKVALAILAGGFLGYLILNLYFYSQGTTPGHRMLGMRVIKEDGSTAGLGTMILREWIGKFISSLVSLLGFIWILIDTNRQGWHDKLVSTYVVE